MYANQPAGPSAVSQSMPIPWLAEARTVELAGPEVLPELIEAVGRGHVLLVSQGGRAVIRTDGQELRLSESYALLLERYAGIESVHVDSRHGRSWLLVFDLMEAKETEDSAGSGGLSLAAIEPTPFATKLYRDTEDYRWNEAAALLCEPDLPSSDTAGRMRRQLALGGLVFRLCLPDSGEVGEGAPETPGGLEAISRTLSHMQLAYHEPITRTELAELAGLSVWHYAERFKELTGESPMRHLNHIRIEAARQKLLLSDRPIRRIAKESGFADEYYFSRKFTEASGMPPTRYRLHKRERLASVNFAYTGQLLALNAVPRAAMVDARRDVHRRSYMDSIPYRLRRADPMSVDLIDYNLELLHAAEPGIILCSEWEERVCRERLPSGLPIAVVPWSGQDWRGQLHEIAALLGLAGEESRWLSAYDKAAEAAGRRLRRHLGSATVSLLRVTAGSIEAYGSRNGGAVLFDDLGLNPAYDYRQIGMNRTFDAEDWNRYAGDITLVIVEANPAAESRWSSMPGVSGTGRIIRIPEMPWLDYSAHAHFQIIAEAERLLGWAE